MACIFSMADLDNTYFTALPYVPFPPVMRSICIHSSTLLHSNQFSALDLFFSVTSKA